MSQDEINPERDDAGNPIWTVDGYLDLFTGDYHDWQNEDWRLHGDNWLPDVDLVTISWVDAENGEVQHARIEGPFEDLQDLEDVVETYFEEGTP